MSSVALSTLRTAVLERTGNENNPGYSTAELNRIINGEGAELHDLVVSRFEDQFTTNLQFTIASGNTYSLASTFYKLRGLDRLESGSADWQEVAKFDFNDRNRRSSTGLWPVARNIRYRVIGSTIFLTPDDAATGTYRLWYIPGYVDLSADGDTLDYPENWHEYVIAGSCAKVCIKEETDPSGHMAIKSGLKERILAMASNRDAGLPDRVLRIRNRNPYMFGNDDTEW